MSMIISATTLANWLESNEKVVVIDVRADLQDEYYGKRLYEQAHIPGASFLDLEKDLSGEVKKHGGNHPLPDLATFAKKVSNLGVCANSTVVVYDQGAHMFAPRAWFLLQHIGLKNVYVLDGGYQAWQAEGFSVTEEVPNITRGNLHVQADKEEIVSMKDVSDRAADVTLIDSRAYERYRGIEEPLYARAGHIPGAVNYDWEDVFDEQGYWKTIPALEEHFQSLAKDGVTFVSCGSGVSACVNILALHRLGYEQVKLYAGSFSDWISYENQPLETKDES